MTSLPPNDPLTALVDRYCAVWNEPNAGTRARLLAEVWDRDATYTDPSVHAPSAEALLAHIGAVVARRPGARIERTSVVDSHHGYARFAWHLVQADGTALPDGLDHVELSADGTRIRRIVGFFGPLAPL